MRRWQVTVPHQAWVTYTVEADSTDEAVRIAEDTPSETLSASEEIGDRDPEKSSDVYEIVTCRFCKAPIPRATAHWHQGQWIGDDCCWDERLRSSE